MGKKTIRGLCLAAAVIMILSSTAMAHASKNKTKKQTAGSKVDLSNYILYQDFSDVLEGSIPEGWIANNSNGEISSEVHNNGKIEKNCLTLTDITEETNGPAVSIPVSGCDSGYILMETRLMFEQTGSYDHTVMTIAANSPDGLAVEGYFQSLNSTFKIRTGAGDSETITNTDLVVGDWYVLRYCFDLNSKTVDVSMTNEKTGATDVKYGFNTGASSIKMFTVYSEHFDGRWYYDYFNIIKIDTDLKGYFDSIGGIHKQEIKKGCEATFIDGPKNRVLKGKVNINLDGKYMYPFDEIISQDNIWYISARSIAYMLSCEYIPSDKKCSIGLNDKWYEFEADSGRAVVGSETKSMSAKCVMKGGKIYLPLEDAFKLLDYGYEFNSETNEAVVKTVSVE